jgi:hypothetical protein
MREDADRRIEQPDIVLAREGDCLLAGLGVDQHQPLGREAARDPAARQRQPHLAGAHQDDRPNIG